MGQKSQFFRCFVEGNTISDGRTITAEMIDQLVETFNAETYTPRINIEHFKGYSPEPPFNGYGDVVAVKAQIDDVTIDGKVEKRNALYMQVDANDQLVKLAKSGQKPFPSVELTPNYAGTNKVGLVGLAFTDSPASIATQKLKFSSSAPGTMHAHGADAVTLELEAAPVDATGITDAIKAGFASIGALFTRSPDADKPKEEPKPKAANDNFDAAKFATAIGDQLTAAIKPIADANAQLRTDFNTLKAQLEKQPDTTFNRSPTSGGGGAADELTDC